MVNKPTIHQPEDLVPRRWYERTPVQLKCGDNTMTKQSHKTECDVNHIMAKFEKTGMIDHLNKYQGDYGDFTQAPSDYQSALDQVIEAQNMFMELPSKVRATFNNDPGSFLAFAQNPDNQEKMVDLGLATQRAEPKPAQPAAEPPAPPAPSGAPEPKPEGEPSA